MQTVKCPVCNSDAIIDDEAFEGDLVQCTICETDLEVHLHPLGVSVIEEENDEEEKLEDLDE